jgi:hypothetical protein
MWASVRVIQAEVNELRRIAEMQGPHTKARMNAVAKSTEHQVTQIKTLVESVIGQME